MPVLLVLLVLLVVVAAAAAAGASFAAAAAVREQQLWPLVAPCSLHNCKAALQLGHSLGHGGNTHSALAVTGYTSC